jgi:hypothetical protein
METVSNAIVYLKENLWVTVGIFLAIAVVGYFVYNKYFAKLSGFVDLGQGCDPQIENSCGENATCQPDETGKGVCFPNPEEEQQQVAEQAVEEEQQQQE